MRTVFVGAQEKPNGVSSYTYNLAAELNRKGFKSSVLSFGSCNKESEYKGVLIKQYKCPGGTMTSIPVLYWKSLPYIIKNRKVIDIVSYQTTTFSILPSLIVRMFGMKACTIIHSLAEDNPKHSYKMKFLLRTMMRFALKFSKAIITVSNTKAKEILDRYGEKCYVVSCGVFLPENRLLNTDVMKRYGIKSGKYFLTIGRVDPIKNLEILIDAFKQHDYGEFQLVIGGNTDTEYGQSIVKRALGCKNIIFVGMVSGDTKEALLKDCMAYCLVSSSEGLPIALLEGMSYGKIPIVTRIPAIQEVLEKHNVGLWSDVKNVEQVSQNMKAVEMNYEKLKSHGNSALDIVKENYTWSQIADKYIKLGKEL